MTPRLSPRRVAFLALSAAAGLWLALTPPAAPAGVQGYTECVGGEPVARIRPGLTGADSVWVAGHEATHYSQARRMGCDVWALWVRTPEGSLDAEAEAYCADVLAVAATEADVKEGARLVAENLLETPSYARIRTLGRDSVSRVVRRHCGV
jgi:hypothetical protein